jgi:fatty acid desaturase
LLALPQALLLTGCQEAKHLCVHGSFLRNRRLSDAVGIACAALVGVNFQAYRHFHFEHHRSTCIGADPEGQLYALSWRTRWMWPLAPLELPWVAWHLNRSASPMVPKAQHRKRAVAFGWMGVFATLIAIAAWQAPHVLVWGYILPLALPSWFDFLLAQAEHYQMPVVPTAAHRDPGTIALDIVLPFGLSWMILHRSPHGVHHRYPGLRWFEAPRFLRSGRAAPAMWSYPAFARRWLAEGPRLWQPVVEGATPPGASPLHISHASYVGQVSP